MYFLLLCIYVYVRSKHNSVVLDLSFFLYVYSSDETKVARLVQQLPFPMIHVSGPLFPNFTILSYGKEMLMYK